MNRERFGPRKSVHQVKFRVTERTRTHTKPNKRAALYASSNKTIDTQHLVQGFGPYHAEIYLLVLSIFVLPGVYTVLLPVLNLRRSHHRYSGVMRRLLRSVTLASRNAISTLPSSASGGGARYVTHLNDVMPSSCNTIRNGGTSTLNDLPKDRGLCP